MGIEKQIVDIIVDIISENNIRPEKIHKEKFKKGFFLEKPYLINRTTRKNEKLLITEKYLLDLINQGKLRVKIPLNAIITPAAKMLIEEGKISVNE